MAVLNITVLGFALVFFIKTIKGYKITLPNEGMYNVADCVNKIMLKYYTKGSEITFININNSHENHDILTEIHRKLQVSIISRTIKEKLSTPNEGYIIYAKTAHAFVSNFKNITREATWNPLARFIVIVDLNTNELRAIFETLLKYHVFNVVIINEFHDSYLYTYNPFENYGCGKIFNRIIDHGKCNNSSHIDLFPQKMVTGFQNCTFIIAAPHWPPYMIDPTKNTSKGLGIEQLIFNIIGEIEQFRTIYTFTNDGENFTVINEAMSAVGPLHLLQKNKVDVIFGGMMLLNTRARLFDYICSHLAFVDEIKLMVKKAGIVHPWKNVYLEFQPIVWIFLVISFLLYFLFVILIVRGKDKTSIFLKMLDCLLAHGQSISNSRPAKCVFIIWIWFAYLVNSFYQSSLVSLSTHPAKDYQISSEQDLVDYHLQPCISNVIQTMMWAELGIPITNHTEECHPFLDSIRTVTEEDNFYTITLYSVFSYNRHKFVDKYGNSLLYEFPTLNKVIYAMYFYKGFPLLRKFHTYTLRLRENGLVEKITKDLDYEESIRHYYSKDDMHFRVIVPWFIYLLGTGFATLTFAIEIIQTRRP